MQRFELFTRSEADLAENVELAEILRRLGCTLHQDGDYWSGTWSDAATGARTVIDLGQPPLELDVQHPPRAYAGWIPLHLVVQVPLVCPHWHAVEGYQFLERLLVAVPDAYALDVEDIQESKDAEAGPFTWSRPRTLASWERLHAVQIESRTDLARMPRGDSLRLWRWRRERDPTWPAAAVLRDRATAEAHAVCVWADPAAPCPLPSTGLVLVHTTSPRLLRRSDLPAGEPLPRAGAARVAPPASWPAGLAVERFSACDDDLWVD